MCSAPQAACRGAGVRSPPLRAGTEPESLKTSHYGKDTPSDSEFITSPRFFGKFRHGYFLSPEQMSPWSHVVREPRAALLQDRHLLQEFSAEETEGHRPVRLPQDMHLNHSPRAGLPGHCPPCSISRAPRDPYTFPLSPMPTAPVESTSPFTRPAFTNNTGRSSGFTGCRGSSDD